MSITLKPLSIKLPLRYRFIISFTILIVFLMASVVLIVEGRLRHTYFTEARKRGESIARNLAAATATSLITYNYILLQQSAERAAKEGDIAYVIILDKEGRIAAYSGHPERQGQRLTDPLSKKASEQKGVVLQETRYGGFNVLDIAVPVFIEGSDERWGLIRIGLSLAGMEREILYTRLMLLLIGFFTILAGSIGSILLSRRITRPLEEFVKATLEVSRGNLEHRIDVNTGDEIEDLSGNFNRMVDEVLSQRRELEERFREIAYLKRYRDNILSSMTNGLLTLDNEGRIITINREGEEILGVDACNITGSDCALFCKDNPYFGDILKRAVDEGRGMRYREVNYRRGKDELILSLNINPLLDDRGGSLGMLVVFEDLTEIRAMEERMRHSDRLAAIGTIAASLAHEIKNPLTAIKTFVQLMPSKYGSETFRKRFNTTVPREINRMVEIIENLLDLSRKPKLKFSPININDVMKRSFDLYASEMERKGVRPHLTLNKDLPPVRGDMEYLTRAFLNLLINAIQAMPKGGEIYGHTSSESNGDGLFIHVTIRDTGIGMDDETARNLFNPFFTTKEKGTGLGLAIVKKIIEEHKGDIEVSSTPGKGSTFKIILPAL